MLKVRTRKKEKRVVNKACSFLKKYLSCHKKNFGGNMNVTDAAGGGVSKEMDVLLETGGKVILVSL